MVAANPTQDSPRTIAPQSWQRLGLIFNTPGRMPWSQTHAQVPTACLQRPGVIRVYYGTRDSSSRTVTAYVDVSEADPSKILNVGKAPALGLGTLGHFDDCGAMPSCIVQSKGARYLYYMGWNTSTSVPYRVSIGLAVSYDNGDTFERVYPGPIMDRTRDEPQYCATPAILIDGDLWRMYYLSVTGWENIDGRVEPCYHIKYAESHNGVDWKREGRVAIDFQLEGEAAIARPTVLKTGDLYQMWFCTRKVTGFRDNPKQSYRIGYAESTDGLTWHRMDEKLGLSIDGNGWESQMVAYPWVLPTPSATYLFYNGNGFGRSGFGACRLLG